MAAMPDCIEEQMVILTNRDPARQFRITDIYESGGETYCRLESTSDDLVFSMPRRDVRRRLNSGAYTTLRKSR